eukprot:235720-Hanusia_phi.AAC.1
MEEEEEKAGGEQVNLMSMGKMWEEENFQNAVQHKLLECSHVINVFGEPEDVFAYQLTVFHRGIGQIQAGEDEREVDKAGAIHELCGGKGKQRAGPVRRSLMTPNFQTLYFTRY